MLSAIVDALAIRARTHHLSLTSLSVAIRDDDRRFIRSSSSCLQKKISKEFAMRVIAKRKALFTLR